MANIANKGIERTENKQPESAVSKVLDALWKDSPEARDKTSSNDIKEWLKEQPILPEPEKKRPDILDPETRLPKIPDPDMRLPKIPESAEKHFNEKADANDEIEQGDKEADGTIEDNDHEVDNDADSTDESDDNHEQDNSDNADNKTDETENKRPTPRESEEKAKEIYGGEEQKSYKDGKEVPHGTPGSTRPDLVVTDPETGKLTAIEVKNYDLKNNFPNLISVLREQVGDRVNNMPEGTEQKIVLDVRGQDLSPEELEAYKEELREALSDIYPNIEIDYIVD